VSRIYLARHGATSWSGSGQHTSFTDLDLTPAGETAAKALGERLRGRRFGLVLVSPRLRARRTAELGGVTDAVTDDDLVEWDYGDYEGLTTDQIRETARGWTVFNAPCPNGETPAQVGARADRVLARVAASARRVRRAPRAGRVDVGQPGLGARDTDRRNLERLRARQMDGHDRAP